MAYSGGDIDTSEAMPAWYRELTVEQLSTLIKPGSSRRTAAMEAIVETLAADNVEKSLVAKL